MVGPLTSLAVGRRRPRAVVRHARRPAARRGRGSGRREPARRSAQPGPRAAAGRRPGAQVRGLADLRQRPPRDDRRRLGGPGHRGRGDPVAGRPVARSPACEPTVLDFLLAFVVGGVPLVGRDGGDVGGAAAAPAPALVARSLPAVPSRCPRTSRWPRRYAAPVRPQAGSLVTVTGRRAGRHGQRGRPGGHPRGAPALGGDVAVARSLDDGLRLPRRDRRRGPGPRDHSLPGGGVPARRGGRLGLRRAGHRRRRPRLPSRADH